MRLLVTRPEPDNERTAAALRAKGYDVLLAPLLYIEAVANANLGVGPFAAILLTSANGARAAASHSRRAELLKLPVLAVGRGSAEAASAAGFADVTSANGDVDALVRLAAERFAGAKRPLLYLAGEDRSGDLGGALSALGSTVRTVVIYRAAKAAQFPAAARQALERGAIDGVLHFSRRSVEAYVECGRGMIRLALAPRHFCLSPRAAEPLRAAGTVQVAVAARPDEASLLDLVAPAATPKA
jgi:uroporphyrinogen-III synthase